MIGFCVICGDRKKLDEDRYCEQCKLEEEEK